MDLSLQVNSKESRAYMDLMDLGIVLHGDGECKPNLPQSSSWYIRCLVVDADHLHLTLLSSPYFISRRGKTCLLL